MLFKLNFNEYFIKSELIQSMSVSFVSLYDVCNVHSNKLYNEAVLQFSGAITKF